tara:strand:+ start:146 stop:646 length:501 start_codon:yes stop_codon:yes gene_type:complete
MTFRSFTVHLAIHKSPSTLAAGLFRAYNTFLQSLHIAERRSCMIKHKSMLYTAGITGIALSIGGCASPGERPDSDLQSAEASLQQAVAADAREYEPVLLNNAQNKVADAKSLIEREKYTEAELLLEQAAVDAQLAGARADTAKARQAVEEINSNIESLRKQMNQDQ